MGLEMLLVSTAVSPPGTGGGSGVEALVLNLAKHLPQLGHNVSVLAPANSNMNGLDKELGFELLPVPSGPLEAMAQHCSGEEAGSGVQLGSTVANIWLEAARLQPRFHIIVNFCFDWLPMYQTWAFTTPLVHWLQLSSQGDRVDDMVARLASEHPERLACCTRAQAMTFPQGGEAFRVLGLGIDLGLYPFCPEAASMAHQGLAWCGQIAPKKGLEDAMAAAAALGEELHIFGLDEGGELSLLQRSFPDLRLHYHGLLSVEKLAQALGRCRCLVATPKCEEAFGITAAEALACGLPVVAYARGGLPEIVEEGRTGCLVEPDNLEALVSGLVRAGGLDRAACRRAAEERFASTALAERFAAWLEPLARSSPRAPPQAAAPSTPEKPSRPSTPSTASAEDECDGLELALTGILRKLGEDPQRDGLRRTPHRYARAMEFLTSGYTMSLKEIVNDAIFEEDHHEMVIVKDIDVYSLCEHHMLPFYGKVHVAYIPNGRIIGLSKFARLVELFARRLQVQERLTAQVADVLQDLLAPKGVAVIVRCAHMCMAMRGVEKQGSTTVTRAMRGAFLDNSDLRQEFLLAVHSS